MGFFQWCEVVDEPLVEVIEEAVVFTRATAVTTERDASDLPVIINEELSVLWVSGFVERERLGDRGEVVRNAVVFWLIVGEPLIGLFGHLHQ